MKSFASELKLRSHHDMSKGYCVSLDVTPSGPYKTVYSCYHRLSISRHDWILTSLCVPLSLLFIYEAKSAFCIKKKMLPFVFVSWISLGFELLVEQNVN